jgi:shikimate kinase
MGAGKTTIGQELSKTLGWDFTDLDELVVKRTKRSVAEIFKSEGELAFRHYESEALLEVIGNSANNRTVIALGGGAFIQTNNFEAIRRSGCRTFHLDADLRTLLERCQREGKTRPLLQDENQFRQLYEERRSAYMKAGLCVDTSGQSVSEVASEVASLLGLAVPDEQTKRHS